jgi:hypothetical protein
VIGHLVLNDFDAGLVGAIDQLTKFIEGSEVLVDAVEVDRAVAVIVGDGLALDQFTAVELVIVVVNRGEPQRGDTEIFR